MKLSRKQEKELEYLEENLPANCEWQEITDKDRKMFLEWSEQGLHKELTLINTFLPEGRTGFHALYWAKRWRERERAGL